VRRTPLQSGSRGPVSKFPHVSYQPCHGDITPAQRCGRPTAWTEALQEGHSRASIAVLRLVDYDDRGGVAHKVGVCGRSRTSFPTENRSTTARDTHRRSTNFFSESDSQTAGLVPGSASAILTSLPPSFHLPLPEKTNGGLHLVQARRKAFFRHSHRVVHGEMASYKHTSVRGVARLARLA
jgi:hypothetical protein